MAPTMVAWGRRALVVVAVLCLLSSHVIGRIGKADSELDRRRGSTGDMNLEQDVTRLGAAENKESDSSRIYAQQDLKLETHGEVIHSIDSRYLVEDKAAPVDVQKASMTGSVDPLNKDVTSGATPNNTSTTTNNTSTEAGKNNTSTGQALGSPPPNINTANLSPENHAPPLPSPLSPSPPPPPPPPPPSLDQNTEPDQGVPTHAKGGKCELEPVIGNAVPSSEDSNHKFILTIENKGEKVELNVTISAPNGWKATPEKLKLVKGVSKLVTITVEDIEVAKLGANISVSWAESDCQVNIPPLRIPDAIIHPSLFSFFTLPGTGALVIGGSAVFVLILGVAGVWGCISWRSHARRRGEGDAKYQELEMSLPSVDITKEDEMSPSADGWDEVWEDDDWEDTEAVRSSSTSLTLSAKGLNARRANKDGWDSSWDD